MGKSAAAESISLGMGTEICHRAFGKHAEKALRAVEAEAKRLERLLSRFVPESEISGINRFAGRKKVTLSPDAFEVLALAAHFSGCCHGFFDVTIGPLVNLWNVQNTAAVPDEVRIRQVLPLVNYADLLLDPAAKTAGLRQPGQSIDLGAIGKGYASDKFVEVFRNFGVTSAFTNLGGNVAVLGAKPDGSPWRVGIRHPRQENRLIGTVSVVDKAVVTSGDDQRYFVDGSGKRRHHILDPSTGYPSESGLLSATIVADSAAAADALSTALFVAGLEKGLGILESFPGAEAILVDGNLQVYVTPGLKDRFRTEEGTKAMIIV